ncbi:putative non-specific serine/threonine protein kinase [Rosa chinensis]|uniref:Putative non-specific serine/threonine protein kinase n=1 Tax=Rosa chinensis TaxID=74649 RepID=A0A2P6SH97_ROSCH|nr:putative non-specific serine/threonine protein kinase [Rosa chinensis]
MLEFRIPFQVGFGIPLISWNQLEGPLPSFFSKALSLDLSDNKFSELDSFLCVTKASSLSFLNLSSSSLSGEAPDCWKPFKNLVFLDLSNNDFSGKIPTTMGFLVSTITLKLDHNKFEGELPSSINNYKSLLLFDIGENKLSGLIPKWLGVGLPNLAFLIFWSNHFYGSIPLELCHLTYMQILDLSMNNISGSIPKCLNNLTTLAEKGY